jgi:hypothetical protein
MTVTAKCSLALRVCSSELNRDINLIFCYDHATLMEPLNVVYTFSNKTIPLVL